MCLLTKQQVAIVSKDVENEGINYSHLDTDLIDHICCDIETRMSHGIAFDLAYDLVKKEFGIKGLRHIQQDTLMLIDKNYRIMKKSMKLIGVLALALMAFGALFKIMHWPLAGIMMVVSFFFTTYVFFPALLFVIYKEVNLKKQAGVYLIAFISGALFMTGIQLKVMHWPFGNEAFFLGLGLLAYILLPFLMFTRFNASKYSKSVYIAGFISLIVVITGLIFKMQHWPGAGVLLTAGGLSFVFVFVPLFYIHELRKSEKLRIDFFFGIVALSYFIVLSFLLSFSTNKSILIDLNFLDKSYKASTLYLTGKNTGLLKDSASQKVIELVNQADLIYKDLEEIKLQIVQTHFKVNKEDAELLIKNNVALSDKENSVKYLRSEFNPNSPLVKLKTEFENFDKLYNSFMGESSHQDTKNVRIFNTEKRLASNNGDLFSWEDYHFKDQLEAAAFNTLLFWQYNIRLAENKVLTSVQNKPTAVLK